MMKNSEMSPTTNVETQRISISISKTLNIVFAIVTVVAGAAWWVHGVIQEINKTSTAIEERKAVDVEQNERLAKMESFMEKANGSIIRQEVKVDQIQTMLKDALARR